MTREDWIEAYEQLENELGRKPTDAEIEERVIDIHTSAIDNAMDLAKEGE